MARSTGYNTIAFLSGDISPDTSDTVPNLVLGEPVWDDEDGGLYIGTGSTNVKKFIGGGHGGTWTSDTTLKPELILQNTLADATGGYLTFENKRGATPVDGVDNDVLGTIRFKGYDDGTPSVQNYAEIIGTSLDTATTAEKGELIFKVAEYDGTLTEGLAIKGLGTDGDVTVDVTAHDGTAGGLMLAGTLVTATATELNLLDGVTSLATGAVTAVNSATENELVTIGSTTTELDAEANLTYDGHDLTATSSSASKPIIHITNTHDGTTSGELRFNKNSTGDHNDVMGMISFYGTDEADNAHERLAYMDAIITEPADGSEAASLRFYVAENDATLTQGLALAGQATADGEVDVTIGAGAASTTTIAGTATITGALTMGSTAAMTAAGLLSVGNQTNITGTGALDGGSITSNFGTIDSGASTIATTGAVSTGALTVTGAATVSTDLTVSGDLNVLGDLTSIETSDLAVKDKRMYLGVSGGMEEQTFARVSNTVTITSATHGFDNGDEVLVLGGSTTNGVTDAVYTVANKTTNTFEIGTDTGTNVTAGAAVWHSSSAVLDSTGDESGMYIPGADMKYIKWDSTNEWTTSDSLYVTGGITTTGGDSSFTGDTHTFTSANANDPLVVIQNTTADAAAPRLKFNKNRGADAVDADDVGDIQFWSYDDGTPSVQQYAGILAEVDDATSDEESGKLTIQVANHDGGLGAGLILTGGSVNDEVDVTLGLGGASVVTIPGVLSVNDYGLADGDIPDNSADTSGKADTAGTADLATDMAAGTVGQINYQTGAGATSFLAANTAATKLFLHSTGTGSAGQAPAWAALATGDIPDNAADTSGTATVASTATGGFPVSGGDLTVANGRGLVVGGTAQQTISDGGGGTDVIPEAQVLGTAAADSTLLIGGWSTTATSAAAPTLALLKSGHGTIGSHTIVTDDEVVGRVVAFGDDGVDYESPVGAIEFVVNGTPGAGDMPGSIEFKTTADAGEVLTLAFTIDQAQDTDFNSNSIKSAVITGGTF